MYVVLHVSFDRQCLLTRRLQLITLVDTQGNAASSNNQSSHLFDSANHWDDCLPESHCSHVSPAVTADQSTKALIGTAVRQLTSTMAAHSKRLPGI